MAAVCSEARLADIPGESVANNTAHCSGFEADRMQAIDEADLTAEKAQLAARTFMVNWDNDLVTRSGIRQSALHRPSIRSHRKSRKPHRTHQVGSCFRQA